MLQRTLDLIKSKPTFGELTLTGNYEIRETGKNKSKTVTVEALCSCGSKNYHLLRHLKSGVATKCRHHFAYITIGKQYGELTVLAFNSVGKGRNTKVLAKCSCGTEKSYILLHLKSGATKSCGCKKRISDELRAEILFLNKLEPLLLTRDLTLLRQHRVGTYFLDGYIPSLNLALEYDEHHHRRPKQKKLDLIREENIKDLLACNFIRLPDNKTNQENINTIFTYLNNHT